MKFLRVKMDELKVITEEVPEKYQKLAGRGLTSRLICDEVPATCHPLGPKAKLFIAPGAVTGTSAPSSARVSVGGKSPLTWGIKEANAGTPVAQYLARLGIKAIIVEGEPKEAGYWTLKVAKDSAKLEPAGDLVGKGLYEAYDALKKAHQGAGFIACGPAAERKLAMSGVCFSDTDGRPSRYSGRGGLGAVMAAKGIKFIVVDPAWTSPVVAENRELFKTGQTKLADAILTHPLSKPGGTLNTYGTAALINALNEAGGLPTRNFSVGRFEGAAKISGERLAEVVKERGGAGLMGQGCYPGCTIKCSNVYPKPDGTELVSCIEYESDWALGANCGIDDLDAIAQMIWHCNDLGIDTIEAGVTIGVAMEAGLLKFGDAQGALALFEEIRKGSALGHILGQGAAFTGRAFGVVRVPTVKGQGMPAYEPRAVKGIGTTYITSPMGADHTAGYTIAPEILSVGGKADPLSIEGKPALSKAFQDTTAFIDMTGYCLFIAFPILDIPSGFEGMVETVNAVLGTDFAIGDVAKFGAEIMSWERQFNRAAGMTSAHDRPPEFMRYEPLPPHNTVWDVPDDELDKIAGN
ncbi:MAG: aldehyde ferredoxin oxidoreductase family protein [Bacillota bacterium]